MKNYMVDQNINVFHSQNIPKQMYKMSDTWNGKIL